MKLALFSFFLALTVNAAEIQLQDYNWNVTDVSSRGLTKEALYSGMDRNFVKPKSSICSNRALMWANDFKRQHDLDTAKIFLFYTKKKGSLSLKTWWYHVAPVINENGDLWVMDAGFGSWIKSPLKKEDWLFKFSNSHNCKEIQASETDLVEHIFNAQVFPRDTSYGSYDCYFKFVPHPIWTPEILAQNLLGKDGSGRPVRVERPEIDKDELYQACMEATTGRIGYALGNSKQQCKEYVGY